MAETKRVTRLRTVGDLIQAHEDMYQDQREGKLDAKTADALNTTLKGSIYLLAKLPLDAAKVIMQSRIKKIELPRGYLPVMPADEK